MNRPFISLTQDAKVSKDFLLLLQEKSGSVKANTLRVISSNIHKSSLPQAEVLLRIDCHDS